MEVSQAAVVPYAALELISEKLSQTVKRLIIIIIILVIALLGTNIAWILYESQYETESYQVMSDDGNANYIGNDGDIFNGSECYSEEKEEG